MMMMGGDEEQAAGKKVGLEADTVAEEEMQDEPDSGGEPQKESEAEKEEKKEQTRKAVPSPKQTVVLDDTQHEQLLSSHAIMQCVFGGCHPLDAPRSVSEVTRYALKVFQRDEAEEQQEQGEAVEGTEGQEEDKDTHQPTQAEQRDLKAPAHGSGGTAPHKESELRSALTVPETASSIAKQAEWVSQPLALALPRLLFSNALIADRGARRAHVALPLNQIIFVCCAECDIPCLCISVDKAWAKANYPHAIAATEASLATAAGDSRPTQDASVTPATASAAAPTAVAGYALLLRLPSKQDVELALSLIDRSFKDLMCFNKFTNGERQEDGTPYPCPFLYNVSVSIGLAELDLRGGQFYCPFTKGAFKTRDEKDRRIWLTLRHLSTQETSPFVSVARVGLACTGPWLDLEDDGVTWLQECERDTSDPRALTVAVTWPRQHSSLAITTDSTSTITLFVDLHMLGVPKPYRFTTDFQLRTVKATDRIWVQGKREAFKREYTLSLASHRDSAGIDHLRVKEMREQPPSAKASYIERLNKVMKTLVDTKAEEEEEEEDDDDDDANDDDANDNSNGSGDPEPGTDSEQSRVVLSGQGHVDRTMTDGAIQTWSNAIIKWDSLSSSRLLTLARRGIPDVMRKEVWMRLSDAHDEALETQYRFFLTQTSGCEEVIAWDLERTFPGHPYFQEKQGQGQTQLKNISHAYAVFDEEIGYVQGLSFISAVLLLHLPEEMAFLVLVRMMREYGLRDLFKEGFESLNLRFYQLGRLMEETLPDVHAHFSSINLEVHMFASQWFLTLYATKFPLNLVFRIFDIFFASGMVAIFQVAIALLKFVKKDILAMDFEQVLSFFRHELPLLFKEEQQVDRLIKMSAKIKVTEHRLAKYEKDYLEAKAREMEAQDPLQFLRRENEELQQAKSELEMESASLTQKLIDLQTKMERKIEDREKSMTQLQEKNETLALHLHRVKSEAETETTQLRAEVDNIKTMYRDTLDKADEERLALTDQIKQIELQRLAENKEKDKRINELEEQVKKLDAVAAAATTSDDLVAMQRRVHDLEIELAEAKLKLVEAECQAQTLEQQLVAANARAGERKKSGLSSWLNRSRGSGSAS